VRGAVFNHFRNHFKSLNLRWPSVDNLLFNTLSAEEGVSLIVQFSEEGVKQAVWNCGSFKSPGPDGINLGFINDFWELLREDLLLFFNDFHRHGRLTKGINSTFIALIPKVEIPQCLSDFRPISLVNCLYKILSKVLANMLRSLLFKVDFEKAYDSMDWNYLDTVLRRMNFPIVWRKWMMECISTPSVSVLANGSPTEEFKLERGLRQGDPLSPFLFLIDVEGLHVMMNSVVEQGMFEPYKVGGHGDVAISHLQFVDDTLLMGAKCWGNIRILKSVLMLFELSIRVCFMG